MMKLVPSEVTLLRVDGFDVDVANAARVSFAKETKVFTPAEDKLLGYLARHDHWTPFAHVGAQLRIKAPIFVARQLDKHQVGLVKNEVSRRYVDSEPEFWLPPVWRGRPANAKQGSTGVADHQAAWKGLSEQLVRRALDLYQHMIDEGVAPEQARMVLPQCAMTEWIWTGSLMAWARVCKLRIDAHAQEETAEVARRINDLMKHAFPASWEKLMAPAATPKALSEEQIAELAKTHGLTGGAVAAFAAALQKSVLGAA
jgi:thymidylate synthase (FAD)